MVAGHITWLFGRAVNSNRNCSSERLAVKINVTVHRLYSARCFRAFSARKSRGTRRETAFYAVSVYREACYCLHHAVF